MYYLSFFNSLISASFWQDKDESEDPDNANEEGANDKDDVDTNESEQTNEANGDKATEDSENDNADNNIKEPETVS